MEFTLTMMLLMAFILFFLQLTLIFGFASFAHYATYMSARALTSAGPTRADQVSRAEDVIKLMLKRPNAAGLDRFPYIAKAEGGGDVKGMTILDVRVPRHSSWQQGVRYTFKSRLFVLPLGRGGMNGNPNSVSLTAESFLLRETSANECEESMGGRGWTIDNGC